MIFMMTDARYKGILYMLLAALGFSVMGGAAKSLKESFGAGQLVFWRNAVGLLVLAPGLFLRPPVQPGGKFPRLVFRGLMGTVALYTLLYCILHIPLGTAMSYNLTSVIFIAIFSYFLFGEYHGKKVLFAVLLGFAGMLLIYKPIMHFPLFYHVAGLISGIAAAIAYMTLGRLAGYYDPRIIVLSFLLTGFLVPLITMIIHYTSGVPADGLFVLEWQWPRLQEWPAVLILGLAALFGQFFVTRAYSLDKAGIVSVFGYANIVYSVFIGMALGDSFPDWMSTLGICCIITSGIIITLVKRKKTTT
jgi:drug/metabolite transporter (DMT)-like permease